MEKPNDVSRRLRIVDLRGVEAEDLPSLSITLKSLSESLIIPIGESAETHSNSFELKLLKNLEPIASTIFDINEDQDSWVDLNDSVSVRISALTLPQLSLKPSLIRGMIPIPHSSCDYIKRLQEIEDKEREISTLLAQFQHKAPAAYREYLDSSPRNPAKRSPLKKKTLETDFLADFDPDYTFDSFFDVALENIAAKEAILLENAALGMLNKMRSLRFDVEEYELNNEIILDFESPMRTLKDSVAESKEQFEAENQIKQRVIQGVVESCKETERNIQVLEKGNQNLIEKIEGLKKECEAQSEMNENEKVDEQLSETQQLRNELNKVMKEIQDLEHEYSSFNGEYVKEYPEQVIAAAVNEKILKLSELQKITNARDAAMQENMALKAELIALEAELLIQGDRENQRDLYKSEQESYLKAVNHASLQHSELQKENETNSENSNRLILGITSSLSPLNSLSAEHENLLNEINSKQTSLSEQLESTIKSNSQLEMILEKEKQILIEYKDLELEYQNSSLIQKAALRELENLANSLLKVSENSITAGRLLRRAEDMVEEQELQQLSMYKLIALIKETKPAYIAVQNDSTDMALAKYLNARHKTLDVNFRRIDKEKYNFGSLKIEIKLEEELVVLVDNRRLGIEDFLEAYTLGEKEKTIKRSGSKISEKKEVKLSLKTGKAPLIPLAQILRKAK